MKGFGEIKKTNLKKDSLIKKAFEFHSKGKISEAANFYKQFIDKGYKDERVYSNYGNIFHNQGENQKAIDLYSKAIKLNPSFAMAHFNLGVLYKENGNFEEAEKHSLKTIELDPNYYDAYSNLGFVLKNLGKLDEAESIFLKCIEINPNLANGYYDLALLFNDKGKFKKAEEFITKTIKILPNQPQVMALRGIIQKKLGKFEEAEISLEKALKINPNLSSACIAFGEIKREQGKLRESKEFFLKAVNIDPNNPIAQCDLGALQCELGELKDAEESLRKSIKLNPNFSLAYHNLGNVLLDLGDIESAEKVLNKSIEIDPNSHLALLNLGGILMNLGKSEESEKMIKRAIKIKADYPQAYFQLFNFYDESNKLEDLAKSLQKFKKLEFISNEYNLFKAKVCFRKKNYKEAKYSIDNISEEWLINTAEMNQLKYWNIKGFIEDKLNNYEFAFKAFEKSQRNSAYKFYDKNFYLNRIDDYQANIKNKFNHYTYEKNSFSQNIGFLIGFPRSGTTLLDNILRGHKNIKVLEEFPILSEIELIIQKKFGCEIKNIYSLKEEQLIHLRNEYYKLVNQKIDNDKGTSLIIDKLPLHTIRLPLINLLFPDSKIIFACRHPYDQVLSCFQQVFQPNYAMANLVSLEDSSIFYDKVMSAWKNYKKSLKLRTKFSKYEDLLNNFDKQTLEIINFLELEWDENIKNYRNTAISRKINTPSSSQVIQPLYKTSIGKWSNYAPYFEKCHKYLNKWLNYFNY